MRRHAPDRPAERNAPRHAGHGAWRGRRIAAALFCSVHHILVKASLCLIAGMIARRAGHDNLRRIGVLAHSDRAFAVLFALNAAALAGIPPLSASGPGC